jgi:hypothetical protein
MKEIPLTQGEIALVSDGDYDEIAKLNWRIERRRNHCYAIHNLIREEDGTRRNLYMHRLIWVMHHGPVPNGFEIDKSAWPRLPQLRAAASAGNAQAMDLLVRYERAIAVRKATTKKQGA